MNYIYIDLYKQHSKVGSISEASFTASVAVVRDSRGVNQIEIMFRGLFKCGVDKFKLLRKVTTIDVAMHQFYCVASLAIVKRSA